MVYPMTLDSTNRGVTAVVGIALVGVLSTLAFGPVPGRWGIAGLIGAILLLAFAFSPRGLELEGDEIRVLRRFAPAAHIPLSTVRGIEPGPRTAVRLLGVGGFFGTYGLCIAKGVGLFNGYSTRREGRLLLTRTQGLPIVVTPDDLEGFTNEVRARLPRAA